MTRGPSNPAAKPPSGRYDGFAIASLVTGILSIQLCLCLFPGLPLGVIAVVFGSLSLRQVKVSGEAGRGLAIAGIVTGVIGFLTSASLIVVQVLNDEDLRRSLGV